MRNDMGLLLGIGAVLAIALSIAAARGVLETPAVLNPRVRGDPSRVGARPRSDRGGAVRAGRAGRLSRPHWHDQRNAAVAAAEKT